MNLENVSDQSQTGHGFWSKERLRLYTIAFLIRIVVSAIFIDHIDGKVFLITNQDIWLDGTNIYYEDTLQRKFNYFPFAYLPILSGMGIYYFLGFNNIVLERIFLRLPVTIGDLVLAVILSKFNIRQNQNEFSNIREHRRYDYLILFNPFLIYTGAYKGQFDVFVAIFALLGWIKYKNNQYFFSGIFLGLAIMTKQYAVLMSFYLFIYLFKIDFNSTYKFITGHIVSVLPVLAVGAILNFHGMLEHAILYHLDRNPAGYSITWFFYSFSLNHLSNYFSNDFIVAFVNNTLFLIFIIMILTFLFLGLQLFEKGESHTYLLKIILFAYISFYLLNKIFWVQYLPIGYLVFCLIQIENQRIIPEYWLNWHINMVPLILIWRYIFFTPADVINFLGDNWILIIWLTGVLIHFLIIGIQYFRSKELFVNKKVIFFYLLIILSLPYVLYDQTRLYPLY